VSPLSFACFSFGGKEKQVPPRTGATPIDQWENRERPTPKEQQPNAAGETESLHLT
jgi:hypothetical protein